MGYTPHTEKDIAEMLGVIGKGSLDELFDSIPGEIIFRDDVDIPAAKSENELRKFFRRLAGRNRVLENSYLGAGSYRHYIPSAVRSVISDGRFFTAYTPYQAEASQGTLQSIFEYQTYIASLTGMEVANASLYDGATAVCEAAIMARAETRRSKILVSEALHPEYVQTLQSYIGAENVSVIPAPDGTTSLEALGKALDKDTAGVVLQNPNFFGCIETPAGAAEMARANKSVFIIATNEPYSLGVIRNPGECGADIACGDAQAFGSPTSFGGPSLGFMAVSRKLMRKIPGRLCGKTVDRDGNEGFVLTLQAREQHIRREKSSSNICSNEALCALAATVHLSLLGKGGFADTARNNLDKAHYAAERISSIDGFSMRFKSPFFNEFAIRCLRESPEAIVERLAERGIGAGVPLGRFFPGMKDCLLIAVTEMNTKEDIDEFADALAEGGAK